MSGRSVEMCTVLLALALVPRGAIRAQDAPPPAEGSAYGSRFFEQLRNIFGRFHDSDLRRVFRESKPIGCSELVGRKGEWRAVAFFNEDRQLGDWCRESLDDVKSDLAVYTFKGTCTGGQESVKVGSEFPTEAGIEAYNSGRIKLNQIEVTLNEPVRAVFDKRTQAVRFELPYLFLTGHRGPMNVYSFVAPSRASPYAHEVTSRWECKAVASSDVTYRFLICRTATVARPFLAENERWKPGFGASAYFILSDGTEALSKVNLTFGDPETPPEKPPSSTPKP